MCLPNHRNGLGNKQRLRRKAGVVAFFGGNMPKNHKKRWIQEAVKHKGSLTRAAEQHGKSTSEEAKEEAKSSDPKKAARGRLAMRFQGKAKHGNIKKAKGKKHHARKRVSGKA